METTEVDNTNQHFKGTFLGTNAAIVWSSEQDGFHFESDNPADPRANLVSLLGREKNGGARAAYQQIFQAGLGKAESRDKLGRCCAFGFAAAGKTEDEQAAG